MEQVLKSNVKHSKRREPLGFVYFGLVLFMVVCFIRPEDWIPGLVGVPLAKITGILVLLALVFSFNDIRWRIPREVTFLSLLLIQLGLATVFSPVWRGGAFNVLLDFSKILPLVIAIHGAVRSMKRLRWILFLQAASLAAIAIFSIIDQHVSGGRLRGILSSVYGNSNDFALALDFSLPLCLAFALTTRSFWKKLAWIIGMLAMVYAVFLTASRGGAIALVVVALVCIWQLGVKIRRSYLLALVPVVIVIWLYGGDALRQRFGQTNSGPTDLTQRSTETSASESAEQRKELLMRSLVVTAKYPFFGVGPGNFAIVSGVWRVTHNSYTQISAEGGIPAFLLYVLILWRGIANLRDVSKYPRTRTGIRLFSMGLGASLAGYLVGSLFASVAYQLFPYCLVAYTSALRLIMQKDRIIPRVSTMPQPASTEGEAIVWQ